MFTGVWLVSFCALVWCGRAIHSDVVPLSPMWSNVARCGSMWPDVVISHTVFFQLIILCPHPHFTHHIHKKNLQNHPHFTRFKIRRSADPQIRILPEASMDLIFAQASIDRAAIDGSRCAIDRCTVGLCHGCRQATRRSFHSPKSAIRPIWLLPDINSHSLHVKSDARNFTIKQLFTNAYWTDWTDWLLLPMSTVPIVV